MADYHFVNGYEFNRTGVQNSYSAKTNINNWNEERTMIELKMREYLDRKAHGNLLVHKVQRHLQSSLAECPLSFSRDGAVHIGDSIMLYSAQTEGVLSVDMSERVEGDEAYAATTSTLTRAHVARNTFVIEAYGNNGGEVGAPLKLGQHFRIRLNPKLTQEPCYLASQPVSPLVASKVSRRQLVSFTTSHTYDTVWTCQLKDISKRFEMEGQPVTANAELVLLHAATRQALSSDKVPYYNDFGQEFEVCAHTALHNSKKHGLYKELLGKTTVDVPTRRENSPNFWAFLTAMQPEMEQVPDRPPAASDPNAEHQL